MAHKLIVGDLEEDQSCQQSFHHGNNPSSQQLLSHERKLNNKHNNASVNSDALPFELSRIHADSHLHLRDLLTLVHTFGTLNLCVDSRLHSWNLRLLCGLSLTLSRPFHLSCKLSPHSWDPQFPKCDIILLLNQLIRQMILKDLKFSYRFTLHA